MPGHDSEAIFSGLSAFPITPADAHGHVDMEAMRRLLQRLVEAGVDSIGLLGSTGTYPYLTRSERRRTLEDAARLIGGRIPLLVGIGALRTDDTVLLAQDAEAAGADALLLAPVSYTPLTDREVVAHFEAVAAAVTRPICIYNNPATTHFTFSPDLIARLSTIAGVKAVKNPAPPPAEVADNLRLLRAGVATGFSIGYSTDWHATEALIAGGTTWYSVAAGLFPKPCLGIMRAVQAGRIEEARRQDAALRPLWDLFRELSSLRVMFAAADALGLCRATPPRPILPLTEADQRRVAGVLSNLRLD